MNNQAAQTMPAFEFTIPGLIKHWREQAEECRATADRMGVNGPAYNELLRDASQYVQSAYQLEHIAALSQTAGVPEGRTVRVIEVEKDGASRTSWSIDGYGNTPLPDGVYKIVRVERPAMIERAAMLAAAPAASGGESHPDALPDGTLSKSTAKRVEALSSNPNPVTPGLSSESGASVSERARAIEMLAQEVEKDMTACADDIRAGKLHGMADASVRAIIRAMGEQALTQQRGADPCLIVEKNIPRKS